MAKSKRKQKPHRPPSGNRVNPLQLQKLFQQAINAYLTEKYTQAETLCKKILTAVPDQAEPRNLLGSVYQKLGKTEQAVKQVRRAIDMDPNYIDAWYNLGTILNEQREFSDAIEAFQQVLRRQPNHVEAQYSLGNTQRGLEFLDEAETSYRKAIALRPNHAKAHNNLGVILQAKLQHKDALNEYQQATELQPDYAEAWYNIGRLFNEQGKWDEALEAHKKAFAIKPDYAEVHVDIGLALLKQDMLPKAIDAFKQAIKTQPDSAEAYSALCSALNKADKHEEAIDAGQKAIALNSDLISGYLNLSTSYQDIDDFDQAESLLHQALKIAPNHTPIHVNLGGLYQQYGKMDQARKYLSNAIELNPNLGTAYGMLARQTKHTDHDKNTHKMEQLYTSEQLPSEERLQLAFGLGKVYEDLGEYDKAFECLLEGNALKRASYEYTTSESIQQFENIKKTFTPAFVEQHQNSAHISPTDAHEPTPIFIVAMPRSGTTLVEQILSSHPLVYGAGELKTLPQIITTTLGINEHKNLAEALIQANNGIFKQIGKTYIEDILQYTDTIPFITDKLPHNFLHVGFIRLALPQAKIVYVERNPVDNCLSIFKNLFGGHNRNHPYAYNLQELGEYHLLFQDLMQFWQKLFDDDIYTIRYEVLVANQEEETRKLLNYCDLPWNEACLAFQKNKRKVKTASVAQVRQGIYTGSVKLSERYNEHLAPLRKILESDKPISHT